MAALNVDKTLTEEISKKGWDAVPAEHKEGVRTRFENTPGCNPSRTHIHFRGGRNGCLLNDREWRLRPGWKMDRL
jgi:hypothetical protein